MQASPPLPRKATDNQAAQTAKDHHKADSKQGNPAAPISRPASPSTPQGDGTPNPATPRDAEKAVSVRELTAVTVSTDWWSRASVILTGIYVVLTAALVIVGAFGVCYARRSLRAIESQLRRMREQVEEMRLQRYETIRQKEVMSGQLETMQNQVTEMKEQTDILKTSISLAKENADAAKANADAALRGVKLQEAQLRQWIDIEEHDVRAMHADPNTGDLILKIAFQIVNNTKMVLTLKEITLRFFEDDDSVHAVVLEYTLPPENGYPISIEIPISGETLRKYNMEMLIIPVTGLIGFEDAFETVRHHGFGFNLRCRHQWFDVALYEGPIPNKKKSAEQQKGDKPN
jgi:hypothetical protein